MSLYPFPDKKSPLHEQWANTFQCLKDAETDGKLDYQYRSVGVTQKPGEFIDLDLEQIPDRNKMNIINVSVMGEYLYLLGYLPKKPDKTSPKIQNSSEFKKAVGSFQKEAGLTVDEWIGDQTWRALLALVGFESDTDIKRWQNDDGTFCRAFRRAVQLRLWVYGIANGKPQAGFAAVPNSSKLNFKKILWCLNIIKNYNETIPDILLYEHLFDADNLLEKAAGSHDENGSFYDPRFASSEHKGVDILKRSFLLNAAKVEIWLFGGDIKIDGLDNYPVKGLGVKILKKNVTSPGINRKFQTKKVTVKLINNEIKKEISKYWKSALSLGKNEIINYVNEITPELLNSFIKPEDFTDGKEYEDEDYSEQIVKKFEQASDTAKEIENVFDTVKSLGMIIYDGLKRLWRWIKKGITKVVELSKNLYRGFFRFAHKAYRAVRLAYTAFVRSVSQYQRGIIDIKSPSVAMIISKDFDAKMICDVGVSKKEIQDTTKIVKRFSSMFNLSCAIISSFVDLLKQTVSGVIGWIRLVLVLVKSYRAIKPYYRELSDLIIV